MKRNICLFSGKRGGFGAYLPLMQLITKDPDLNLQILLGDMHASKEFGKTADEARKFFPNATIEVMDMGAGRGDTSIIRAENLGIAMQKTPAILARLKPNIVLVHGDRGEHLMVASAALNLGVPIAHTQGGEVSGNIDDIQRHAISKLAHLHFPETEQAKQRLLSLGEEPWRIHLVGSTYIDRIAKKMYTPVAEAKKKYGLTDNEPYYIVLFHPDTFETPVTNHVAMESILEAVKMSGQRAIVLYPCSDPGYQGIIETIEAKKADPNFLIYKNIDNLDFLGLLAGAEALIGNSSAAFVEAPYLKLPAINIGNRQKGRERESNILDAENVKASAENILMKMKIVKKDQNFRQGLNSLGLRIGDGQAAEKILHVLKTISLDEKLLRKRLVSN